MKTIKEQYNDNLALAREEGWSDPEQVAASWTTEEVAYVVASRQERQRQASIEATNKLHFG